MPRLVDPPRHERARRRRRDSQRHLARLHPRRSGRLRRVHGARLDGGLPRQRRAPARRQGIRRPGRRHHQLPARHLTMAAPESVTIVVPAFNESGSIGGVVTALRAAAPWHEVLVVDDGSTDGTGEAAGDAGARVLRHPYNKGNGASVKTGIRAATSDWIAIIDADGQHRTDDAKRIVEKLGDFDLVIGARDPRTQATAGRRIGNAVLNRLAAYLTERPIPDLTSGLRA